MGVYRTILPATIVLVIACGGAGEPSASSAPTPSSEPAASSAPQTLRAAGGRLEIVVPEGSPEVSVADLDLGNLIAPDGWEFVAAIELTPDGATFEDPVVLEYELDPPVDGLVPMAVFVVYEADGWRMLADQEISISTDRATISSVTEHFSRYAVLRSAIIVQLAPLRLERIVGEVFTVRWYMTSQDEAVDIRRYFRDDLYFDFEDESYLHIEDYDLEESPFASGAAVVTGSRYRDQFACADEGEGQFGYSVLLTGRLGTLEAVLLKEVFAGLAVPEVESFRFRVTSDGGVVNCIDIGLDPIDVALRSISTFRDFPAIYRRIVANLGLMGMTDEEIVDAFETALFEDGMADGLYSISNVDPGDFDEDVDLWDMLAFVRRFDEIPLNDLFNFSVFECGATTSDGVLTVCPDDVGQMEAGDVVIVAAVMNADLPTAGASRDYTYAAVFDSDADPANNWQYQGDFDWDFFRDTDRWYQVQFDAASGAWSMDVVDLAATGAVSSAARVLIDGDTIIWVIPASEFAAETPLVRVSAFRHDGTFAPQASGGDVSGENPTEPPRPVVHLDL